MDGNGMNGQRASWIPALWGLGIMVADAIVRNLPIIIGLGRLDDGKGMGLLAEIGCWLSNYIGVQTSLWMRRMFDIVTIPAFALFLLAAGPVLARSRSWRLFTFCAGLIVAIAFLGYEAAMNTDAAAVRKMWMFIIPDALAWLSFFLIASSCLCRIVNYSDQKRPWNTTILVIVGLYLCAPASIAVSWVVFLGVGWLLFSPLPAYCSVGFNTLFATAFVGAIIWLGRYLYIRHGEWKWIICGAVLGCVAYTHGALYGGGVYADLLRFR